jgi:hypothetical protein
MLITGRIFTLLTVSTALRFTATGAPLAARHIRILPMNQYALWPITFGMPESYYNSVGRSTALCFTASSSVHAWEFVYDC